MARADSGFDWHMHALLTKSQHQCSDNLPVLFQSSDVRAVEILRSISLDHYLSAALFLYIPHVCAIGALVMVGVEMSPVYLTI